MATAFMWSVFALCCLAAILGVSWFLYDAHIQRMEFCTQLAQIRQDAMTAVDYCRGR